jgi:hypothetical protein
MKRRYNHETKQWDIVLREQDYYRIMNELECLKRLLISQPKPDMFQATGQPCSPPFLKHQSCCKLPDGHDLAGIEMAHNEQIDTFRFRGFN